MTAPKIREYVEVIGIFGVIVSLIFVGYELRQNSKVAKLEAYNAYVSSVIDITLQMSSDPKLAGLVMKAFKGQKYEELDDEDRGILLSYYLAHVHSRSSLYTAIHEGIISESFGSTMEQTSFFDTDAFRAVWPILRQELDEDFVAEFEQQPWNKEGASQ